MGSLAITMPNLPLSCFEEVCWKIYAGKKPKMIGLGVFGAHSAKGRKALNPQRHSLCLGCFSLAMLCRCSANILFPPGVIEI